MKKVGIVLDKLYVDHDNGQGHPECADRALAIVEMLQETKLIDELVRIQPRDATKEEITLVHDADYYESLRATRGRPRVFLDADTSTCPVSFDAAVRAAGGVLAAIEAVLSGEVDMAFPIVRPPGHHAERSRAMGFCLINNIAVGAAYLRSKGFSRILVVDWDVHHGNGTQHIFEQSPEVLFFSAHQFPFYPGTGAHGEIGAGDGKGFTINVPLPAGMGNREYIKIFSEILTPVIEQFKPEFILVSAGYDSYFEDPLGGMAVKPDGFAQMTRFLKEAAQRHCGGKIVYVLEGGYNLEGLWWCVQWTLAEMMEKIKTDYGDLSARTEADEIIEKVKKTHSGFWKF
ncbi:MAG: histone deacetylase family protein [Deltaproteobacteria bacterium]